MNLCHGNVLNLPFTNHSFDKIISIHTLYFWREPLRASQEIQRVLKPGGTLALTILPRERWPGGGTGTEYCKVYSGDDAVKLLLDAGFSSACVEPRPPTAQFREVAVIGIK